MNDCSQHKSLNRAVQEQKQHAMKSAEHAHRVESLPCGCSDDAYNVCSRYAVSKVALYALHALVTYCRRILRNSICLICGDLIK